MKCTASKKKKKTGNVNHSTLHDFMLLNFHMEAELRGEKREEGLLVLIWQRTSGRYRVSGRARGVDVHRMRISGESL